VLKYVVCDAPNGKGGISDFCIILVELKNDDAVESDILLMASPAPGRFRATSAVP
jgi:hypothetical protein